MTVNAILNEVKNLSPSLAVPVIAATEPAKASRNLAFEACPIDEIADQVRNDGFSSLRRKPQSH